MSTIYDDLRESVERHHDAGQCTRRWRNDARTAINAIQRYDPAAANLVEIEEACEEFRLSARASEAVRRAYSGRVQAAINLHRGEPTERWPDGAGVRLEIKLPPEMRSAVLALAEQRGCAAADVVRAAIQAELDAHPPARARGRKKSARNS